MILEKGEIETPFVSIETWKELLFFKKKKSNGFLLENI